MATFGNSCTSRATQTVGGGGTLCLYDLGNPVAFDGVITQTCVYIPLGSGLSGKWQVRRNGNVVAETDIISMVTGLNTLTGLNIPILAGDCIGVYLTGTNPSVSVDLTGGSTQYCGGTNPTHIASVQATYTITNPIYAKLAGNDANDGSSWGSAKRNIKEGLNTVRDGGTLHIGFEDYSAQAGIKFTKNLTLKCETVGGSGGTGTTILPKATWQQGSYGGDTIIDRSNTNTDVFNDTLCGLGATAKEITIYNAKAQRFIPSHRALEKVTLKLKRLLNNDLYVEIRESSGSGLLGNPTDATGKIAFAVVPYSSISTLALSEVTITFNQDLGNTNPKWIVVCLNGYNPSSTNTDVSYEIAGDSAGNANEYFANKCGNSNWLVYTTSNLYFKTYRGI